MNIKQALSPNYNDRKNADIALLVLHYTDTMTLSETLEILQSPRNEVSAHYLVDEDGTIYQMVDEKHRAWHAGKSYWNGISDINAHSIGIEIQNTGHRNGYKRFPDIQMQAVSSLCRGIIVRHPMIKPSNIVAHSDIAPDRKKDPGELFDWEFLAEQGVGLWAKDSLENAKNPSLDKNKISELMGQYGYNKDMSFLDRLIAFQRHFEQATFVDGQEGAITDKTAITLKNLIAQKKSEKI